METPNSSPPRLLPSRGWWLALFVILLCAAALRYTGYNFSLPYVDHVDEASYTIAGRMIIDFGSPKPIGMQGYPPGIIAINYFFIRLFQDPSTPPTTILWMVRLVSVTFSLATIVALALLAFRLATPLAGLLAAGLWTFTPIIVEFSRYATADNFVTFFSLLALFLVLTGTRFNRRWWIYAAILSQIFAILFKYQAVFLLPVIFVIPLWRLTDRSISRRAVLTEFAVTCAALGLFFFWLIFLFPALDATSSPDWSAPNEKLGLPSPTVIWENFLVVYTQLESALVWWIGWVGLIALGWRAFRRQVDLFAMVAVVAGTLAWVAGISFYGDLGNQQFRQFISAGAFLYALRAVGLVGWVFLIDWALRRLPAVPRRFVVAVTAVVLAVIVIGIPNVQASIADAVNHTLPDRRNDLAHWMDISLPSGRYISDTEEHKVFNRDWGGYAGVTEFPFVEVAQLDSRPLADWRADNVQYAIVSTFDYQRMQNTAADQDLLAQTLLLKTFPPDSAYRGPDMVVLRLSPIQHAASGTLGSIRLVGYDLSSTASDGSIVSLDGSSVAPGSTINLTLYWQADAPTVQPDVVFNHLTTASGDLIAQIDGDPLNDLRRPSTDWNDPLETLISRTFTLTIPPDAPAGEASLYTGFYSRADGSRLQSPDGADQRLLTTLRIE
ncbi:MAG: phospholipid carrier-dependent glycosyltransferase [Chloroflexi bacterium]|nr:phospholipid carrier-dependent glycosyltransferase [Chloroflexota bacterium]